MTIYIVRDEDSLDHIAGVFFNYDKANAFKHSMGSYYVVDDFNTNDEPEIERFIMVHDNGSEEVTDEF